MDNFGQLKMRYDLGKNSEVIGRMFVVYYSKINKISDIVAAESVRYIDQYAK